MKKTALLIIDVQNFYFNEDQSRLYEPEKTSAQIAKVLNYFRKTKQTVIHVKHVDRNSAFYKPNDSSIDIHESVAPIEGEIIIEKAHPNAFLDTSLYDTLKKLEIKNLVIVGMMSHMCVDTTVRSASDHGFQVTVLDDCCTTKELTFRDTTIDAVQVHKAFMASFEGFFGHVCNTEEYFMDKD